MVQSAPIVLVNVNCFQLVTVYVSITLPRVSRTYKVDSPALNQAHPVSPCIKPQCAQSCLLDCTGWFTAVFQAFIPQFPIPTVFVTIVVSSSVFACFSLSQYPLPPCCIASSGLTLACLLTTIPARRSDWPQPSDFRIRPTPAHGPDLDYPRHYCLLAIELWTVWLLCVFCNKPLVSSWTSQLVSVY